MAFIDIFNFKKYFATPSDSQVARYGHLNVLAKRITDPVITSQVSDEDVIANGYTGKISLPNISTQTTKNIFISNSFATANSAVLVSVGCSSGVDFVVGITATVAANGISVTIVNSSTEFDLENPVLNFLIIN